MNSYCHKEAEEQDSKTEPKTSETEQIYIPDSIQNETIETNINESNINNQDSNENFQSIPNINIDEIHQEKEIHTVSESKINSDDDIYYELDSNSLINVFDDLDNYQKNEEENNE